MLYLMVEEKYRCYPWCQRALQGLWEDVRKKRVKIQEITSMDGLSGTAAPCAVLLLGASEGWVYTHACQAHSLGIHPIILSNRMPAQREIPFSSVTMDIQDSIRKAVDYLHSLGCGQLALYGCNRHATSDPWRENAFYASAGQNGKVFYNHGSLERTFEAFWAQWEVFDGVICANDYAALSLVRHLQERGIRLPEQLYIVGCGDLFLSRISTPSITSISDGYEHFGRAALSIYSLLIKEEAFSAVTILLHSQLHPRMTTGSIPYSPDPARYTPPAAAESNPFFSDVEIAEMVKLETLLNQCDITDMEVIRCLLSGKSYPSIAESCFISETAVKYRVKKMEETCGVGSRDSLVCFLEKFF